jgi:hypothetical protein
MNTTQTAPEQAAAPGAGGRKKAWKWAALAVVAVVAAVVAAAALATSGEGSAKLADRVVPSDGSTTLYEKGVSQDSLTSGGYAAEESREAGAAAVAGQAGSQGLPDITPKVIKTGKAGLEIDQGAFYDRRGDVYFIVESAGGYIQSENTGKQNEAVRGTFLLRVPFDRFDQVFTDLSGLGKVLNVEVASQDVTQEYVDLEGRIRHLEAQEQFYLDLIAQAKTIQEMISIREQLDQVQLDKEQALGRKNYLDNQTSYSLITLNLAEKSDAGPSGSGFWDRISGAFESFGRACRELLVGLAYALPYLAILAVLALVGWALLRRRRKRGAGEAPAA